MMTDYSTSIFYYAAKTTTCVKTTTCMANYIIICILAAVLQAFVFLTILFFAVYNLCELNVKLNDY